MNWIVKTLHAAHDGGFLVYLYIGGQSLADGFIKEIDDETIIIVDRNGWADPDRWTDTVVLICSITHIVPVVKCLKPEKSETP